MDPSVSGSALATLGEDLFLLSIRARDGKLITGGRIDSALMATELIRLAAAGRAWIAGGRIVARDRTATGDAELDAALLSLAGAAFLPRPETWVGLPRRGIRAAYAARLISAGVLRLEPSRVLGGPRYQVIDASRMAAARSQLDAITQSSGTHAAGRPADREPADREPALREPADSAPVALAGLASAIGLGDVLYPGRDGKARRARMAQIARQQVIAQTAAARGAARERVPPAGPAADPPTGEAAGEAAGELVREGVAGDLDPALLPAMDDAIAAAAMDDVIAAAVHALTAVIDSGAIVGSEVVGTHFLGINRAASHGDDGHHASSQGHDGHGDGGHAGAGGFGHR